MTDSRATLHLTGTRVAEYFRFGCERQLRYDLVPVDARGPEVPRPNRDASRGPLVGPRPGAELLRAAGRRWERRKLQQLLGRYGGSGVLVAGWTEKGDPLRLPAERVLEALRAPGELEVLVQPELRVPDAEAFARRFGLAVPGLEIAVAVPDLIRIRRLRDGRRLFQVVDIKASREARIGHFAQVAYYSYLLEEICRSERIEGGAPDVRWGRIWSRDGRGPRRFALGSYRYHVEKMLREDLSRIAAAEPAGCAWHVSPRCSGCMYLDVCRAEAERTDDLSLVAGISPLAKRVLQGRGIRTVKQLAGSFRRDTYEGCNNLESQPERLKQRAQAIRYGKVFDVSPGTHLMPRWEDVRVIVTADSDPVTGRCFAVGLRVEVAGGARGVVGGAEVWIAGQGTAAAEGEMLAGLLSQLEDLLAQVAGSGGGTSLHFYVYDRGELAALRELLLRHVGDGEARPTIARLLRVLSPRTVTAQPDVLRSSPGTVLVEAVSALFALPLPFAYDLAATSDRLRPDIDPQVYRPEPGYAWPLSSQIAFERIHNVWRSRPYEAPGGSQDPAAVRERIREAVLAKLAAIDSVVRAVRERSSRRERLQLRKEPFAPGDPEPPIPDPSLETLRIFAELESSTEAVNARALHALPSAERARRLECIRGLELVERREDGALVFSFDAACRDAKFRPGDFNLVLTNDDGTSLAETARHPWKRRRLMVELVEYDLHGPAPLVVLAPSGDLARAEAEGLIDLDRQCVLDRASMDYNTRRVVGTLRALAAEEPEPRAVRAILEGRPTPWSPGFGDADGVFRSLLEPLEARLGRPVLNADQERAWREAFGQRVSLVWGPPGTGKTYLLAWMLIGLAAAARRSGRPCRILIAAATHRAITNVLLRLAEEIGAAGLVEPLRAVKLRGSGSEADAELDGTSVELAPDARLPAILDEATGSGEPVVVGCTVWSLWKQMRAARRAESGTDGDDSPTRPWFDVVVVDEASQMKVGESLIALSGMRADGQVILCGDHRQLAPVVRGEYGPDAGSLFGSVFEHMAQFYTPHALRESRRMNRALVAYPRKIYYPGLESMCPDRRIALDASQHLSPEEELLREVFLQPDDAVVLCTYRAGHRAAAQRNQFEAHLAARIVRLARRLMVDPETGRGLSAGAFVGRGAAVISPHRAQNSAIYAELRRQGMGEGEMPVVDTVERMQGNERDLIVVSYAVADREYAEAEAEFLLNSNRFNVSITRARAKLVVLVSEEVLDALPLDEPVLTGSMALKGYRSHCSNGTWEVEVPGPEGSRVWVRCHYRSLPRSAPSAPSTAAPPPLSMA